MSASSSISSSSAAICAPMACVRVVFRQNKAPDGQWVDAPVDQATGTDLENAILTRARQIRMSTVAK